MGLEGELEEGALDGLAAEELAAEELTAEELAALGRLAAALVVTGFAASDVTMIGLTLALLAATAGAAAEEEASP